MPSGLILGIETSCDETAAAVVRNGTEILSSVVASQISLHANFGGVVPELASREHLRNIVPVVRAALTEAATKHPGASRSPQLVIGRPVKSGRMPSVSPLQMVGTALRNSVGEVANLEPASSTE